MSSDALREAYNAPHRGPGRNRALDFVSAVLCRERHQLPSDALACGQCVDSAERDYGVIIDVLGFDHDEQPSVPAEQCVADPSCGCRNQPSAPPVDDGEGDDLVSVHLRRGLMADLDELPLEPHGPASLPYRLAVIAQALVYVGDCIREAGDRP